MTRETSPHELALLADPAHSLRWLPWRLREQLAAMWTPSRVAELSTASLLEEIGAYGVTVDRATFVQLAAGRDRAWSIATEEWRPRARGKVPDNLLELCAVELWKRWLPDRPSPEVLGSWIAEGYRRLQTSPRDACELWLRCWKVLESRIGRRSPWSVAATLVDGTPLHEWLFDLARELCAVTARTPEVGPPAVDFCREVVERLRPAREEVWLRERIQSYLGDTLFHLGRREEGERVYRELIGSRHAPQERKWLAEALAYSADAATADEIDRATTLLAVVPDYGIGVGAENEALQRLASLRSHPPLRPASPLARLTEVGEDLPQILAERILAVGRPAEPALVALIERAIGADEASAAHRPAHHAMELLARMRATRGVEPMLRYLARCEPFDQTESCVYALRQMGPGALEPLLEAHAGQPDPLRRRALWQVLAGLDVQDERILTLLIQGLEESPDDAGLCLWEYGDERAIPFMRRRLEALGDCDDARSLRLSLEELAGRPN